MFLLKLSMNCVSSGAQGQGVQPTLRWRHGYPQYQYPTEFFIFHHGPAVSGHPSLSSAKNPGTSSRFSQNTPLPLFLMFSLNNCPSPGSHLLPGCKFPLTCAVFQIEPSSVLMCPFSDCKSFLNKILNKISFHHCRPPLFFLWQLSFCLYGFSANILEFFK